MAIEKSGGIFHALKGLVLEETPDKNTAPAAAPATAPAHEAAPPAAPAPAPAPAVAPHVDEAAREKLESALTVAAPEGYREVTDTLSTLADSIADERSRYTAMIKLLGKRGMSVDHLLEHMDKAIGILEEKSRDFNDELEHQVSKKVGSRQQAVADLDQEIKAKREQAAALTAEADQLSVRRGEEAASIEVERQKISAVQAQFSAAYSAVLAGVTARREKIASYGKGT